MKKKTGLILTLFLAAAAVLLLLLLLRFFLPTVIRSATGSFSEVLSKIIQNIIGEMIGKGQKELHNTIRGCISAALFIATGGTSI